MFYLSLHSMKNFYGQNCSFFIDCLVYSWKMSCWSFQMHVSYLFISSIWPLIFQQSFQNAIRIVKKDMEVISFHFMANSEVVMTIPRILMSHLLYFWNTEAGLRTALCHAKTDSSLAHLSKVGDIKLYSFWLDHTIVYFVVYWEGNTYGPLWTHHFCVYT